MLYNTFDKKSDKPQEISYFKKKLKNLPLYFNNNSVCQTPKYFALIFGNSFSFEQNLKRITRKICRTMELLRKLQNIFFDQNLCCPMSNFELLPMSQS